MDDDLKSLWRDDDVVPEVDVATIRKAIARFERQARSGRNREYVAGALVVPPATFFLVRAVLRDQVVNAAGWAVALAATAFVVGVLATRGPAPRAEPATSLVEFVKAYRAALLHQARLNAWAPLWYFAPFVPAFVLFGWSTFPAPGEDPTFWWVYYGFVVPLIFVGGSALNLWGASRLRARARDLPAPPE